MNSTPFKRILVLAANPRNTDRLRLDEEMREIEHSLNLARRRDQFELCQKWAVRSDDLRRALMNLKPQIIHFSGHGAGAKGLVIEDEIGAARFISEQGLANLLGFFRREVECVLLNACYSEAQARAISHEIKYVIGMTQAIGDKSAIKFATAFYDALGAGYGYEDAFRLGCIAIDLEGLPSSATPKLLIRESSRQQASDPPQHSNSDASSSKPTRTDFDQFLAVFQKIPGLMIAIVVLWIVIGMRVFPRDSDENFATLIRSLVGGVLSGAAFAWACYLIVPSLRADHVFLKTVIFGFITMIVWILLESVFGSNNGLLIGGLFGAILMASVVWNLGLESKG